MKTLNCILTELKKVVLSPYFLIGIITFALMCFTSSAYTDYSNNREMSIFEMITKLGTKHAQSYKFSAQYVCSHGFGNWIVQFLSIIVAFPFVKVLCDERRFSEKRYIICRTGKLRYCLSKFLSAIISGAALCALGFLLFSAAVYIIFPSITQFPPEQAETLLADDLSFPKKLLITVIMGAGAAVLPFLVSVFTTNQYFCICIPFLLQYMQMTAANKLFLDNFWEYPEWQRTLIQALFPSNLRGLAYGWSMVVKRFDLLFPEEAGGFASELVPPNLYNQMTPFSALAQTFVLLFCYLVTVLLVMLLFGQKNHRAVCFLAASGIIGFGVFFTSIKTAAMWVFPMANAIVWLHFTEIYRDAVMPTEYSYIYFGVIIVLLIAANLFCAGGINAASMEETEG